MDHVVKPLEWRDSYSVVRADTEFGSYMTSASGKILTVGVAPMSPQIVCANLDDAKATAQADYTRRILSTLDRDALERDIARRERERCAQIAEKSMNIVNISF